MIDIVAQLYDMTVERISSLDKYVTGPKICFFLFHLVECKDHAFMATLNGRAT